MANWGRKWTGFADFQVFLIKLQEIKKQKQHTLLLDVGVLKEDDGGFLDVASTMLDAEKLLEVSDVSDVLLVVNGKDNSRNVSERAGVIVMEHEGANNTTHVKFELRIHDTYENTGSKAVVNKISKTQFSPRASSPLAESLVVAMLAESLAPSWRSMLVWKTKVVVLRLL